MLRTTIMVLIVSTLNRYQDFATLERTLGKAIDVSVRKHNAAGGNDGGGADGQSEISILSSIVKLFVQV